jgi:hypothetical protein
MKIIKALARRFLTPLIRRWLLPGLRRLERRLVAQYNNDPRVAPALRGLIQAIEVLEVAVR